LWFLRKVVLFLLVSAFITPHGSSAGVCVYVGGLHVYVSMWKVCMYMYMCVCAGSATADARYLASSQEPDEELQSLLSYEEVCQKAIPDLKVNQHSALS